MKDAIKEPLGLSEADKALIERALGSLVYYGQPNAMFSQRAVKRLLDAARATPLSEGEWRCPKCGAAADERFDCCEAHIETAAYMAGLEAGRAEANELWEASRARWISALADAEARAASPSRPLLEENEGLIASGVLARGAVDHGLPDDAWAEIPTGKRFGRRLTVDAVPLLEPGTLLRMHSDDPWFNPEGNLPTGQILAFTGKVNNDFLRVGPHLEVATLDSVVFPGGGWLYSLFQFVSTPSPALPPRRTDPPADGIQGVRS